jgi:DNA-binding NarL/FixJ family response regulator
MYHGRPRTLLEPEGPRQSEVRKGWDLDEAELGGAPGRSDMTTTAAILDPLAELRDAERRVAEIVALGWSNKEIAAELFVSVKTVEFHLSAIYRKLGLSRRAELVRLIAQRATAP